MTKEELKAKLKEHERWLRAPRRSRLNAFLCGANLAGADLTDATIGVWEASPEVCDALSAVFAARMALLKTGYTED